MRSKVFRYHKGINKRRQDRLAFANFDVKAADKRLSKAEKAVAESTKVIMDILKESKKEK